MVFRRRVSAVYSTLPSKRDIMAAPRQFGDIISGNCTRNQELLNEARSFIVGVKAAGGRSSEIKYKFH